ncbi:hypothetical protein GCM10011581_40790 [Saccharopolyspora subtropica]|uniref:Uncharacterized protein n=1 Tax=Saccharopolyspora thermophila TaxID=89367 RepID=A0A917K608_9PSEU|nr:hypothetical protein [Saccharopolyspora subtropica]GGI99471.1 hypothetical protein GCM10011581_40790 [Saccharopolyspora subtropica]
MTDAPHYWLPTPNPETGVFVRHAFCGRRWEGQSADTSVCGVAVAMAEPSEMDWRTAPTCMGCNEVLKQRQAAAH